MRVTIDFILRVCYNYKMKYLNLGGIEASRLALGLMRIADKPMQNVDRLVRTALDIGVNVFDNADIYGGGSCESKLGELIGSDRSLRNRIVVQTKCGIKGGMYDLSYGHITSSVESSLKRLNTDHIDILLLHRPDTLMREHEIARAFDELEKSGKVRLFGVSNFSAQQTEFLQRAVKQKLVVNQLQMGPAYCPVIDYGINVNTAHPSACDRSGGVLEYCRMNGVTIQTYGTMQCEFTDETGYFFRGAITEEVAGKKYFALVGMLNGLAQKYGVTPEAVAIAWVLHHPASMQAIVGTTLDKHMFAYKDCCEVPLTDFEWYSIYTAAGHKLP